MTGPILAETPVIPAWVNDFDSFRHWTRSDEFPERGLFAYLDEHIWTDLYAEELLTHNRVKVAFTVTVGGLVQKNDIGSFVADRMRWCNVEAGLSTEPDGLFHSWPTLQSGRLRFVQGARGGIMELEGTPDMVLEIVSASSVNKDTVRLRELYWRAGVNEYWLVDARSKMPRFEILRHDATGYASVESQDGWLASVVLGRAFQLKCKADRLGHPKYVLEVRPEN